MFLQWGDLDQSGKVNGKSGFLTSKIGVKGPFFAGLTALQLPKQSLILLYTTVPAELSEEGAVKFLREASPWKLLIF